MARRSISIDEWDDYFEVDDQTNELFWMGKAVVVEKRLKLETYQIWLATLATIGAVASGIHPFGASFGWW